MVIGKDQVVALAWDCTSCKNCGIDGKLMSCPGCGSSRPEGDDVLYAPEMLRVVTDPDELRNANAGADWICAFCGNSNRMTKPHCGGCGATMEDSERKRNTKVVLAPAEASDTPQAPKETHPLQPSQMRPSAAPQPHSPWHGVDALKPPHATHRQPSGIERSETSSSMPWIGLAAGVLGGLALLVFIVSLMLRTSTELVTATSFPWERTIDIQQLQTFTKEGWTVPTGARVLETKRKVHHYDDVFDHKGIAYKTVEEKVRIGSHPEPVMVKDKRTGKMRQALKDLGNGYAKPVYKDVDDFEIKQKKVPYEVDVTRKEPRFQMWYKYEYDSWEPGQDRVARGTDQHANWPEVRLTSRERENGKSERYTVVFTLQKSSSKTYTHQCAESEWRCYELGGTYKLKLNAFGNINEISAP